MQQARHSIFPPLRRAGKGRDGKVGAGEGCAGKWRKRGDGHDILGNPMPTKILSRNELILLHCGTTCPALPLECHCLPYPTLFFLEGLQVKKRHPHGTRTRGKKKKNPNLEQPNPENEVKKYFERPFLRPYSYFKISTKLEKDLKRPSCMSEDAAKVVSSLELDCGFVASAQPQ